MKLSENKPKKILLCLTEKQFTYLDNVSKKCGLTIADLLRVYIDSIMFNSPYENNTNIE